MATHPSQNKMMKAAHLTQFCAEGTVADAILFGDVPTPRAPGKKEVLIGIKASALNVDDVAICQDTAAGGWCAHPPTPSAAAPLVPGIEYAGVVLAVGPGCTRLKVGDRVCGIQNPLRKRSGGTWAEQALAPESHVVPLGSLEISFVEAAAVCMAAFVSGDMYKRANLPAAGGGPPPRCLVLGASGGLGTALLRLLAGRRGQAGGARVHIAAVCSGANAEVVRRLGADETVDYTTAPFEEQLATAEPFDVVFDFVGGSERQRSAETLLRRGGKFITAVGPRQKVGDRQLTCCEFTGWACGLTGRLLWSCFPCAKFKYEMGGGMPPMKAAQFNAFVVEAGLRAEVAMEVPFAEAPLREALRRVASRHTGGKVVINFELEGQDEVGGELAAE